MENRLLLIDSDIFILLAASGVLERVASLLGFELKNVRRLHPLKRQLTRGGRFLKRYSQEIREAVLDYCDKITPLTDRPDDPEVVPKLVSVDDIDYGEALLYGLVAEQPSFLLASGDKRAMIALAKAPELCDVSKAVSGRIICFETVLQMLIEKDGVGNTAKAFGPLRACNKTLQVIFSPGAVMTKQSRLKSVDSFLDDLVKSVGDGFLFVP
ncbi:MAG: hypothetical protein HQ592_13635 [Planctomycetes bacterium]|nr:hypothetical protein [Planctomycetota bacterium]